MADADFRASYVRSKLDVLIPSQIKALRGESTQAELAEKSGMKQSRISAMETPGKTGFNIDTLVRLAATFNVGLVVKFVPFSEMLRWENGFSQDEFKVTTLSDDLAFLNPERLTLRREEELNNAALLTGTLDASWYHFATPALPEGVIASSTNLAALGESPVHPPSQDTHRAFVISEYQPQ